MVLPPSRRSIWCSPSYEKKLLTYPRTDSQFITEDMESTARQVIGIVSRKVPLFEGIIHEPDIGQITTTPRSLTIMPLSPPSSLKSRTSPSCRSRSRKSSGLSPCAF